MTKRENENHYKNYYVMQLQMNARVAAYLLCYSLEGRCILNLRCFILNDLYLEKCFCLEELNFSTYIHITICCIAPLHLHNHRLFLENKKGRFLVVR